MDLDNLLERCKRGDGLAWEALVRRFQGRIYGLARHYLGDREEARDVAQEVFVRLYRSLDRFEPGTNFIAWALRITRNCAIDRLRQLQARPPLDLDPPEQDVAEAMSQPPPEHHLLTGERHALLYRALGLMSAANREMILLKDIQGLKQHEIAEMLSLPLGTVKTRTSRARLELARCLLELDPSFGAS